MKWYERLFIWLAKIFGTTVTITPVPPPIPPTPEKPSLDEIDLSKVAFSDAPDVGTWPVTVLLEECGADKKWIAFPHPTLTWPTIQKPGWDKPCRGNVWVIAEKDGKLCGATIEYLLDQQRIPHPKWGKADIRGPLGVWSPRKGEKVYVMLSTMARGPERTANERSNARGFIWP